MNEDLPFDLRQLRHFVAVAEELHFGRAAERLGMAQPPLSQQIKRLETELGTQLFDRTSRRVALTDAGHALLAGATRILAQMRELSDEVQRTGRGETGALTVAFAASLMFHALPHVIRTFRHRVPNVHLELRELSTGSQLDALRHGEIDIGFMRQPGREKGLHIETVMEEPLIIAMPARHRLAKRPTIALSALAHDDFVLFPKDVAPGLHAQVFALCREAGFTPHVTQESREQYTTMGLVDAEVGVTIIPASVQQLGWSGVVYKSIASSGASSQIAMGWRADHRSPVIHAFAQLVREVVTQQRATPDSRTIAESSS